jgi:hypothetical protein
MSATVRITFKEWAAVCTALANGRQSIILRKGGIHEGRDGFRVAHREFWLYPTFFHQQREGLSNDGIGWLRRAEAERPIAGCLPIAHLAHVIEVRELRDPAVLPTLDRLHIWSRRTIVERFEHRTPGLFLLIVRVHRLPRAVELPESPSFAGCRSWVELPMGLPTEGLIPALTDAEFHRACQEIHAAIGPALFV